MDCIVTVTVRLFSLPLQLKQHCWWTRLTHSSNYTLTNFTEVASYTLANCSFTGHQAWTMSSKVNRPLMSFTLLLFASLLWVAEPHTVAEPADCAKVIKVAINGTDGKEKVASCKTLQFAFTNCTITNSTQFLQLTGPAWDWSL